MSKKGILLGAAGIAAATAIALILTRNKLKAK
jgi:hypothetical protein